MFLESRGHANVFNLQASAIFSAVVVRRVVRPFRAREQPRRALELTVWVG
ncbi:hypothetical protein [Paraburkholderia sp. BR13444]